MLQPMDTAVHACPFAFPLSGLHGDCLFRFLSHHIELTSDTHVHR
jgi:hypothetical protein